MIKKNVLYTTRTNLKKRIFHIRTSILLKIGGPLQLVVVLVLLTVILTMTYYVVNNLLLIKVCNVYIFALKFVLIMILMHCKYFVMNWLIA